MANAAAGERWEPGQALGGRGVVRASRPLEQRQSLRDKRARVELGGPLFGV